MVVRVLLIFIIFFQMNAFSQIRISIQSPGDSQFYYSMQMGRPCFGFPITLMEEIHRQEKEFQEFLNDREARYQKILDRVKISKETNQIYMPELTDISAPTFSVEESDEQVDRILAKLEEKNLRSMVADFKVERSYHFTTDLNSAEGQTLDSVLVYRNNVATTFSTSDGRYVDKVYLINAADHSLDLADSFYGRGDYESAEIACKFAVGLVDAALSLLPGVSWGRDVYEALTGKDLVYGTKLSTFERSLAILGASTIGISSGISKGMKVLSQIASSKTLLNIGKYKEAFMKAERIGKSAEKFEVPAEKIRKYAIDLAHPSRKSHIINGELLKNGKWGGGHMYPGKPGKTVFPESWSEDKIMHEISDIVTDPSIVWKKKYSRDHAVDYASSMDYTPKGLPQRFEATGVRDSIEIKVVVEPAGEGIISGYPLSGKGVVTNPL
jgi:hypothetical protein